MSRSVKPVPQLPAHTQLAAPRHAEHERAEAALAPPLPLRPAADHELLAAVRLHLQPVARRACPRGSGEPARFAITPSSPCSSRRLEQRLAVVEGAGDLHDAAARDERLEPLAALAQRQADERLAVELEQVEDRRRRAASPACPAASPRSSGGRARRARRPRRRRRSRASAAPRRAPSRRPGSAAVRSLPFRRAERRLAAADVAERAVAVPLRLEQPALAGGHSVGGRREHRLVAPARGARRTLHRRACAGAASSSGRRESFAGTSVHVPRSRSPCEPDGEPAVALLLDELVGARGPRSRPCRRRSSPPGSRPRRPRSRAGGPRRGRRGAARPGSSGTPFGTAQRRERAVPLEPEVVVEPPRVVALDDEDRRAFRGLRRAERLRRPPRVRACAGTRELSATRQLA